MDATEPPADWPEKVWACRNAGIMLVGHSSKHQEMAVLLGGRFYWKRKEYMYTDFGGGVDWKQGETPLQGACREFAEELLADTDPKTAERLAAAIQGQLVGGQPYVHENYAMFVAPAAVVASCLEIEDDLDGLYDAACFVDQHGKANPELSSVAMVSVAELLRGAQEGTVRPLCLRPGPPGPAERCKLRPVMVGPRGSLSTLRPCLEAVQETRTGRRWQKACQMAGPSSLDLCQVPLR